MVVSCPSVMAAPALSRMFTHCICSDQHALGTHRMTMPVLSFSVVEEAKRCRSCFAALCKVKLGLGK